MTSALDSETLRRQGWYGYKRVVKRILALRLPHWVLRRLLFLAPAGMHVERLPAPAHVKQVQARMAGVSFTMLNPAQCVIAKELYWGQGRRPRSEDQLALDVFAVLGAEADVVFDIGSYTGLFSLLSARRNPKARVHAFELVPEVAAAAFDNVVHNDLLDRVTVHAHGVGPEGTVRVPAGGKRSALPDFFSVQMNVQAGVSVPVRPLDEIVDALTSEGDRLLLKIDVEGAEDDVLRSGCRLLRMHAPDVLCELLFGRANVDAVRQILEPLGYHYFLVREHELVESSTPVADPRFRDWLFTRKGAAELQRRGIAVRPADA